jgi:hypothetical protein
MPITTNQFASNAAQQPAYREVPRAQQQPARQQQQQFQAPPPKWIQDLVEAAQAGDNELRKELRKVINQGQGDELVKLLEQWRDSPQLGDADKQQMSRILKNVNDWIADPSQLEEGGRFWGGLLLGTMLGRMFSRGYGYGGYGLGGYGLGGYGLGGYGCGGYYGGYYPSYGYGGWW